MPLAPGTTFANDYELITEIGSGSFGVVWKATDRYTGEVVALKISHEGLSAQDREDFKEEYMRVHQLRHPNLLTARQYREWERRAYLVLPLCRMSLLERIRQAAGQYHSVHTDPHATRRKVAPQEITEEEVRKILTDVTEGLCYLHKHEVVHCDLKPDNILCDTKGNWLITDFGISTQLRGSLSSRNKQSGARGYASPEILHQPKAAKYPTDIFSLGVTLFELCHGQLPREGDYGWKMEPTDRPLGLPQEMYSSELTLLLQSCLRYYPNERPTAEMIRQYLQGHMSIQELTNLWKQDIQMDTLIPEDTVHNNGANNKAQPPPQSWRVWVMSIAATLALLIGVLWLVKELENRPERAETTKGGANPPVITIDTMPPTGLDADELAWQDTRQKHSAAAYQSYLQKFPNGKYATEALDFKQALEKQAQLEKDKEEALRKQQQPTPKPSVPVTPAPAAQPAASSLPAPIQKLISDMVYIPGGTFWMGCSDGDDQCESDEKQQQHRVTVSSFKIGKYEVTQEQYREVMGNNPSSFKGDLQRPVEMVSWEDAVDFCNKLSELAGLPKAYDSQRNRIAGAGGFRLPTEAEWEYAARGGTTTRFHTGDCLSTTQANYDGNYPVTGCSKGQYRQTTVPVNSFAPNAYGLYNMLGNVWEWCNDWYSSDYYSSTAAAGPNPKGSATGSYRVLRGGSWYGSAGYCRVSRRGCSNPGYRDNGIGFRVFLSQ